MNLWWMLSNAALWPVVLFLGFLLLGALRAVERLRWRLEQLEAITPTRTGRGGLKPGQKAPDFTLTSASGAEVSLHDFAGRPVLLVFTQSGCGPCHAILPELNRRQGGGGVQVLVVNNGEAEAARQMAAAVRARFPVLVQEQFHLSRRYEVFATPFAFLIDGQGVVRSKGIVSRRQHIDFVLAGARDRAGGHGAAEAVAAGADVS